MAIRGERRKSKEGCLNIPDIEGDATWWKVGVDKLCSRGERRGKDGVKLKSPRKLLARLRPAWEERFGVEDKPKKSGDASGNKLSRLVKGDAAGKLGEFFGEASASNLGEKRGEPEGAAWGEPKANDDKAVSILEAIVEHCSEASTTAYEL